jgi:WbqC-like protein family
MVLLDHVQFPRGHTWLTRNRLKSDKGELWVTVPVWRKARGMQRVCDVQICRERNWQFKHLRSIREQYANAPYLQEFFQQINQIYARNHDHLINLNVDLIRFLWKAFRMKTSLILQSDLGISGKASELLISICLCVVLNCCIELWIYVFSFASISNECASGAFVYYSAGGIQVNPGWKQRWLTYYLSKRSLANFRCI